MTSSLHPRLQLAAIARVRWQVFAHSLRTKGGVLELASRIFVSCLLLGGGIAGAVGLGIGARIFVSEGRVEWIALLLWSVFVFWQVFPIMGSVFTETLDLSDILRFPLTYRSYFLVRLAYGAFDPSTLLGCCWLTGIGVGIGLADSRLLPWTIVVLGIFALLNICFMQMILAWVERWLAQRRTREIFGILFFLLMIGLQLLGPLAGRYGPAVGSELKNMSVHLSPIQRASPPGMAALAIANMAHGSLLTAFAALGVLLAYGALTLMVMGRRVRAQYRGENLSEAPAQSTSIQDRAVAPGWLLPGLSARVSAVFEKELRYLARSGPMLLTLITPVIMLAVFGLGPSRNGTFLKRSPDLTYPLGAAYTLLLLTNVIYNNFGADGGGVQLYFAAPMRLRTVVLGKNLAHTAVLAGELVILWVSVSLMFHPPTAGMTLKTLAAMLFAIPVNLAAGNLLSLYSPKRVDLGIFGRQRASQITVLISFLVQAVVIGCCVAVFVLARYSSSLSLTLVMFAFLALIGFSVYFWALQKSERLAVDRREALVGELCRAQ
jgi:ABC-2 type transport system permease protein